MPGFSQALAMAKQCQVTVKSIKSGFNLFRGDSHDNKAWEFHLSRLADLSREREYFLLKTDPNLKEQVEDAKDKYLFDTERGVDLTDLAEIERVREQFNNTEYVPGITKHTANTATTLLPCDGKIHIFGSSDVNYVVGLGFSIQFVHLNGEYTVFSEDAFTDLLPWKIQEFKVKQKCSISINDLIFGQKLDQPSAEVRAHNELFVGVNAESLCCIFMQPGTNGSFATPDSNDYYRSRFDAIFRKAQTHETFGRHLPIIIVDKINGISEYTLEQQNDDLKRFLGRFPDHKLVNDLLRFNIANDPIEQEFTLEHKISNAIVTLQRKLHQLYAIKYRELHVISQIERADPQEITVRIQLIIEQRESLYNEIRDLKAFIEGKKLDAEQSKHYQAALQNEHDRKLSYCHFRDNWCEIICSLINGECHTKLVDMLILRINDAKSEDDLEHIARCLLLFIQNRMITSLPDADATKISNRDKLLAIQLDSRKLLVDVETDCILRLISDADGSQKPSRFRDALVQIQQTIQAKYLEMSYDPLFIKICSDQVRQFYLDLDVALFQKLGDLKRLYARPVSISLAAAAAARST